MRLGHLPIAPIDCAAEAGVHSFTESLRVQLRNTRIKALELAPPMTRTPPFTTEIGVDDVKGIHMMDVFKMVSLAMRGLEKDHFEICPGLTNVIEDDEPDRSPVHDEPGEPAAHAGAPPWAAGTKTIQIFLETVYALRAQKLWPLQHPQL